MLKLQWVCRLYKTSAVAMVMIMHQQCITQESNKKASVIILNLRSIKMADIVTAAGAVMLNVHD